MTIYTYTGNAEPDDDTDRILLRNGGLTLGVNQYANLTEEEIREIRNNTSGCVIQEGIIGTATSAE